LVDFAGKVGAIASSLGRRALRPAGPRCRNRPSHYGLECDAFLPRPVNQRSAQPHHGCSRHDRRPIDRSIPNRQIGLRQDFGGWPGPRQTADQRWKVRKGRWLVGGACSPGTISEYQGRRSFRFQGPKDASGCLAVGPCLRHAHIPVRKGETERLSLMSPFFCDAPIRIVNR
jgi:hypothetical protein